MSIALTIKVVDSQSNQSFEASFERFPVRIGRNQLNDLHIDRPYVSQFHASIEVTGMQIWAKDLGSTNGTMHQGQKMVRDQPLDLTNKPELQIGPVQLRFSLKEVKARATMAAKHATVLEIGTPEGAGILAARQQAVAPGQEDPFIRQLVPYIEAYRSAWANVYRLVYEHLTRLQADVRTSYIKRLLIEHGAVAQESDFQKVAQYYGVSVQDHGELTMTSAALAAMRALSAQLGGGTNKLDDPTKLLAFARQLRDSTEVFLKCFVSLRDGYEEFQIEVLRKERLEEQGNQVGSAKDHKALGEVLFSNDADSEENCRHLHEVYVEVMSHQVALMNGVMQGVGQLLDTLSPRAVEEKFEQSGKKVGLFSNKYEGLWEEYQTVHADYHEDTETFRTIFGPQFSRAYAAKAGEAYQASGDVTGAHAARQATPADDTRR